MSKDNTTTIVNLAYQRSTKGTHVFVEVDGEGNPKETVDAYIPSLYIRKAAFAKGEAPDRLQVAITVG